MDEKSQKTTAGDSEIRDDDAALHRLSDGEDTSLGSATSEPDRQKLLQDELDKTKKEYLYLLAEFENYKKHVIKERSDMRKYGSERLVIDLLNVLDIFETALRTEVTADALASFRKGMEMTATEFKGTLQRHGVEEMPAEGQPFDPNLHEAISSEATDTVAEGHISRVFKKPFKLHDRVIRPGQVVVATKPKA